MPRNCLRHEFVKRNDTLTVFDRIIYHTRIIATSYFPKFGLTGLLLA